MLEDQIGGLQQGIAQLLQDYVTIDELLRDHARSVGWKMMHCRAGLPRAERLTFFPLNKKFLGIFFSFTIANRSEIRVPLELAPYCSR
jgi:hypothetical protein